MGQPAAFREFFGYQVFIFLFHSLPLIWLYGSACMYLLTIKDGFETRHIGPYPTTKKASDDLQRVLEDFSERARWKIHALESPERNSFSIGINDRDDLLDLKAS